MLILYFFYFPSFSSVLVALMFGCGVAEITHFGETPVLRAARLSLITQGDTRVPQPTLYLQKGLA